MCEIKPKHEAYFKLEVYTTNPRMSEERFLKITSEKLLAIEMLLNEDMRFRFHIHEDTKHGKKVSQNRKALSKTNVHAQPDKSFRQVLEETKGGKSKK